MGRVNNASCPDMSRTEKIGAQPKSAFRLVSVASLISCDSFPLNNQFKEHVVRTREPLMPLHRGLRPSSTGPHQFEG